jgi:hypothetical protein
VRRVRRVVAGATVAAFLALWGVVYATVHGDESLASPSTASTAQTSTETSTPDDDATTTPPAQDQIQSQTQLPPASTSQS